jgi:hypothetical protein
MWSSSASFNFQFSLISLRPSSSCLHLILCLLVTSAFPSTHTFEFLGYMQW